MLSGDAALDVLSAAGSLTGLAGTITTAPLKNNAGTPLSGLLVDWAMAIRLSDRSTVTFLAVTTNGAGQLVLTDAALVPGADYLLVTSNTAGTAAGVRKYAAA